MKLYYGTLTRVDGLYITPRTNSSHRYGYWTSNPDDFKNSNKSPMRMFLYEGQPEECESPGIHMEVNAMEKINNTYRFFDYSNIQYEFVLEKVVEDQN